MSRLVVTLAALVVFSCSALTAFAAGSTLPYGVWEPPAPTTEATASWLGCTGLIITPTAMVDKSLRVQGFAHVIQTEPEKESLYGIQVAISDWLEASVVRMTNLEPFPATPGVYEDKTAMSFKLRLPLSSVLDESNAPEAAVGVFDVSNEVNRAWYMVVTQHFANIGGGPQSMGLHVGYGDADHAGRLDGIFAGIDFCPVNNILLQAEYDTQDVNACVRFFPAKWLSLDAGIVADEFALGATLRSEF